MRPLLVHAADVSQQSALAETHALPGAIAIGLAALVMLSLLLAVGAMCGKAASPRAAAAEPLPAAKEPHGDNAVGGRDAVKATTGPEAVLADVTATTSTTCEGMRPDPGAGASREFQEGAGQMQPLSELTRESQGGQTIRMEEETVPAVCKLLHAVCDRMEGRLNATHTIRRSTIREGIHAAIAEATSCGVTVTCLIFPDARRYNRQLRSYDRRWLVDFMPNKSAHNAGGAFTHNDMTVMMPPHVMVDKCSGVCETLDAATTPQLKCTEVFMICIQLYHQIYAFHRRDKVVRDISVNNVVSTLAGAQRRWTLLEYCAVAGVGAESHSVPVRQTPPELAEQQMDGKPLKIVPSFDVWQLGIMVYEALGGAYWPATAKEAAILHTLATASAALPHETRPLEMQNMNDMLRILLCRVPDERPTAEELRRVLEEHDNSGTVGSFTSPWVENLYSGL